MYQEMTFLFTRNAYNTTGRSVRPLFWKKNQTVVILDDVCNLRIPK